MNRYKTLFDNYVSDMRQSMHAANDWWFKLLEKETIRLGDKSYAEKEISERWPFGPASHPYVLATYRKYFLECEKLNSEIEAKEFEVEFNNLDDTTFINSWGSEDEDEDEDFLEQENPTPAWNLLIDMLPGRHDDLADFLSLMVFAPIGLDEEDRFV